MTRAMTLHHSAFATACALLALLFLPTTSAAQNAALAGPICAPLECASQGPTASVAFAGEPSAAGRKSRRSRRGSLRVVITAGPGQRPKILVRGPHGQRRVLRKTTTIRNARPGRWRIIADPIRDLDTVTFATKRVTKVRLGRGARGRVAVAYKQRVASNSRVADPSAVRAVGVLPDGRKQIAIADPDGKLQEGAVLSTGVGPNTPRGMLVKVDDVTRNGAIATVTASDAPLTAIGPQAAIAVSPKLSLDGVELRRALGSHAKKGGKGFSKPYSCKGGVSATVDGSVDFDAGTQLKVEWGGWGDPFSLKALAKATFDQSAKLTVTVGARASCELDLELLPKDIEFTPIEFTVGPVPVVIVPKLNFILHGKAEVGGEIKTTITESLHMGIGVEWDDGLRPIKEFDKKFDYTPLEPNWDAHAKIAVGPKLIFDIYDVAGPYITADVFAQLDVDSKKDPWWTLKAGIEAGVGIRLKVWKIRFDEGIPDLLSKSWTIAEAKDPIPPRIRTEKLDDARAGDSYRKQVTAERGKTPYTWSLKSGELPDGLSFDPGSGVISGTPTGKRRPGFSVSERKENVSSLTIGVKDKKGKTDERKFDLEVKAPLLVFPDQKLPRAFERDQYRGELSASGSAEPYEWSISKGELPEGLRINSGTGTISGSPKVQGDYRFTVTVRGDDGQSKSREFEMNVGAAPLTLDPSALADATVGSAYSKRVVADGGTYPHTYAIASGSLPAGLSFDATNGKITGTPTTHGSSPFTVKVTDAAGRTTSQGYTITVQPAPIEVLDDRFANGTTGQAYSDTLSAQGGVPPYTWQIASGTPPAGLTFDGGTATLSGTPTVAADTTLDVKVTDSLGASKTVTLPLLVTASPHSEEPLGAVSCPTTTWCMATDIDGKSIQWNGTTWGNEVDMDGYGAEFLDCLSPTFCMSARNDSHVQLWNGTAWDALTGGGVANYVRSLSCVSTTLCFYGTSAAGTPRMNRLEWNGTIWSGPSSNLGGDSTVGWTSVSCPTADECWALTAAGAETRWTSAAGGSWTTPEYAGDIPVAQYSPWVSACSEQHEVCVWGGKDGRTYRSRNFDRGSSQNFASDPKPTWDTATCVRAVAFCALVGNSDGVTTNDRVLLWDSRSGSNGQVASEWSPDPTAGLNDIACASEAMCIAVDDRGRFTRWDGTAWTAPAWVFGS